jgi:hypothetical protein
LVDAALGEIEDELVLDGLALNDGEGESVVRPGTVGTTFIGQFQSFGGRALTNGTILKHERMDLVLGK